MNNRMDFNYLTENDLNTEYMYYYKLTLRYVSFWEHYITKHMDDEYYYKYKLEIIFKALFLYRIGRQLVYKDQDTPLCGNIMEEQMEFYRLGVLQNNNKEKVDACMDIAVFIINTIAPYNGIFDKTKVKLSWKELGNITHKVYEEYQDLYLGYMGYNYNDNLSSIISKFVKNDETPMILNTTTKINFLIQILYYSYRNISKDFNSVVFHNLFETLKVVIHRFGKWNDTIGKLIKYDSIDIDDLDSINSWFDKLELSKMGYVPESRVNQKTTAYRDMLTSDRYFYIYEEKGIYIPKIYKPNYITDNNK